MLTNSKVLSEPPNLGVIPFEILANLLKADLVYEEALMFNSKEFREFQMKEESEGVSQLDRIEFNAHANMPKES